ncbi:MAG: hypothetical protein ACXVAM_13310, partial [Vulcanimicrobiaceae bacterium]
VNAASSVGTGSIAADGDGTYMLTRTSLGVIYVSAIAKYQSAHATSLKSGGYRCSFTSTNTTVATFTFQ